MPRAHATRVRKMVATHLQFLGLRSSTIALYRRALSKLFKVMHDNSYACCRDFVAPDMQLCACVNWLHANGETLYKAANALSGMKKLVPKTRRHLDRSCAYYKNLVTVTKSTRAVPLPADWAKASLTFAVFNKQPVLGVFVLAGVLGSLCTSELRSLVAGLYTFCGR